MNSCRRIVVQDNMSSALVIELALKAYGILDSPETYMLMEVSYKIGKGICVYAKMLWNDFH